jgi:hypothetical protein
MEFGKLKLAEQQKKVIEWLHYHEAFLLDNKVQTAADKKIDCMMLPLSSNKMYDSA